MTTMNYQTSKLPTSGGIKLVTTGSTADVLTVFMTSKLSSPILSWTWPFETLDAIFCTTGPMALTIWSANELESEIN